MKNLFTRANKYVLGGFALLLPSVASASPATDVADIVTQADAVWILVAALGVSMIAYRVIVKILSKLRG